MLIQRLAYAADHVVVIATNKGLSRIALACLAPHAGKGMLENRQQIGRIVDTVDQFFDQQKVHVTAEQPRRPPDRFAQLIPGHSRGEILAAVNRFGQFEETDA